MLSFGHVALCLWAQVVIEPSRSGPRVCLSSKQTPWAVWGKMLREEDTSLRKAPRGRDAHISLEVAKSAGSRPVRVLPSHWYTSVGACRSVQDIATSPRLPHGRGLVPPTPKD